MADDVLDIGALVAERDRLRAENDSAKARIKELNAESAGRRLNEDRLGKIADERAAAIEAERKAREDALAALKGEYEGKITAAEKAAAERAEAARERVMRADLRVAAKDAGMVDLDGLKLLDTATLKLGDDGSVQNAAEALAALKQAKPWAFGQASTSSPAQAPKADAGKAKLFKDMTPEEQAAWKRSTGVS